MTSYEVIAYWSPESSRFVAEVPQLPGWTAEGCTYREAMLNADKMLQEWVDEAKYAGMPVPRIRGRFTVA